MRLFQNDFACLLFAGNGINKNALFVIKPGVVRDIKVPEHKEKHAYIGSWYHRLEHNLNAEYRLCHNQQALQTFFVLH